MPFLLMWLFGQFAATGSSARHPQLPRLEQVPAYFPAPCPGLLPFQDGP